MPIDASIPLQAQPLQIMSPMDMYRNQLAALQIQEQQQQMQSRNALKQLMSTPGAIDQTGLPTLETIGKMSRLDPEIGARTLESRNRFMSYQAEQAQQKLNLNKSQRETMAEALETYTGSMRTIPQGSDPRAVQANAMSELNDKLQEAIKSGALLPDQADIVRRAAAKPENANAFIYSVRRSQMGEYERMAADRYGYGTPQFYAAVEKYMQKKDTVPALLAGENAQLDDATLKFMAERALAGDTTVAQGLGTGVQGSKNRVKFNQALRKEAEKRGMNGQELAAKVAEFQGIKSGERTLGTRTANVEMAVTEAQNVMPLALEASAKVNRTKYPALNKILLAGEKGVGDEDVVRLGVATNSLINIYSRAISPTGVPTVSDKEHARELLESAWAKGQYAAGVDQLSKEMEAARKSPGQVREGFRKAVSGKEEGGQITISSREELQKAISSGKLKKGDTFVDPDGVPHKVK